jgi:hypothetical protein
MATGIGRFLACGITESKACSLSRKIETADYPSDYRAVADLGVLPLIEPTHGSCPSVIPPNAQ